VISLVGSETKAAATIQDPQPLQLRAPATVPVEMALAGPADGTRERYRARAGVGVGTLLIGNRDPHVLEVMAGLARERQSEGRTSWRRAGNRETRTGACRLTPHTSRLPYGNPTSSLRQR
jgi:hypothetical protein